MFCAPSALLACPEVEIAERNPKVFAKGLLIDYQICKYKQAMLKSCIEKYEAKVQDP